jgi:hypothetical protein
VCGMCVGVYGCIYGATVSMHLFCYTQGVKIIRLLRYRPSVTRLANPISILKFRPISK